MMEEDYMPELATIDRLLKEREHINDIIELLENQEIEKAIRILKRDRDIINEALQRK